MRVRLLEKTNARYLTSAAALGRGSTPAAIGLIAMDVSFISATLVLPAVLDCVHANESQEEFHLIVLVKPQFEAGREQVGKGGIVRDPQAQQAAVRQGNARGYRTGRFGIEVIDSPILGTEGNREFLLHARFMPQVLGGAPGALH